jgi:hypothetical protein
MTRGMTKSDKDKVSEQNQCRSAFQSFAINSEIFGNVEEGI